MSQIGKNIKKHRIEKSMTQDQLAEKLNVTRQAVSNWETGKTQPNIETLTVLGEYFGISVEELIYGRAGRVDISLNSAEGTGKIFGAAFLLFFMILILAAGVLFSNIWWIIITVSLVLAVLTTALYQQSEKLDTVIARIEQLEKDSDYDRHQS